MTNSTICLSGQGPKLKTKSNDQDEDYEVFGKLVTQTRGQSWRQVSNTTLQHQYTADIKDTLLKLGQESEQQVSAAYTLKARGN